MASLPGTMMPFLYPAWSKSCGRTIGRRSLLQNVPPRWHGRYNAQRKALHTAITTRYQRVANEDDLPSLPDVTSERTLDPAPGDYSSSVFADTAELTVVAGSGGHGCVSFLREKYISAGPANGGDGGTGGNVYISAVPELKSLHKLQRRREVRAGNGRNGMGKSRGGQRGEDVVIEVPLGTIVREISRWDPIEDAEREYENEEEGEERARKDAKRRERERKRASWVAKPARVEDGGAQTGAEPESDSRGTANCWGDEEAGDYEHHYRRARRADMEGFGADAEHELDANGDVVHRRPDIDGDQRGRWRRDRWLLQPSSLPSEYVTTDFPALPRPRRSNLAALQPPAPIQLDLSKPSSSPMLLAAGAMGGLGNPHFVTKTIHRPKFATKGNVGMKIKLQLELKLLADLGFVGMPNAGKSTLLRALSNSRARVGSWAFTTLVPNLGTVVLDDNKGRAKFDARDGEGNRVSGITVADIPGLIVGASRDRGLGLDFLRHVERAKVLAFVVDLSAGDSVDALKGLWTELDAYQRLRDRDRHERSQGVVDWGTFGTPMQSTSAEDGAVAAGDEPVMWTAASSDASSSARRNMADLPPISEKPWFVVASKADLSHTQENFARLQDYLAAVSSGRAEHPAGHAPNEGHRWKTARLRVVPVSAIKGHGVQGIVECTADLLAG